MDRARIVRSGVFIGAGLAVVALAAHGMRPVAEEGFSPVYVTCGEEPLAQQLAGGALVGSLLALVPIALHRADVRAGRRKLQEALAAWGRGGR